MPLTFPTEKTDQLSVDARTGLCNMVTPDLCGSVVVNSSNALPRTAATAEGTHSRSRPLRGYCNNFSGPCEQSSKAIEHVLRRTIFRYGILLKRHVAGDAPSRLCNRNLPGTAGHLGPDFFPSDSYPCL